jgi:predicted TPR repeat methyltransferase
VFRLNVILYPESSNAHDSFGEALMKAGMTDEAIARYRRSLELDPGNHNAEQMIAAMGG